MLSQTSLLAFAALVALAAAGPTLDAELINVPAGRQSLAPRADGTADIDRFLRQLNSTMKKYKSHALPPMGIEDLSIQGVAIDLLEKRATKNLALVDQDADSLYYGKGKVGGQSFTIDFDTGSADFFIPGPNCQGCKGTPYDQGGQDQGKTTTVTYGSGTITGENYLDTVCVATLCAPNTNVISLTNAQGFSGSASNSLMGMGFSTISNSNASTFFEQLMSLGKVTQPEFSFFLGRQASGTGASSQMTLGGRNPAKFTGKPKVHKVTRKGYWQLALGGAAVDKKTVQGTSGQAAIDTGTTIIILPTASVDALFAKVDGAVPVTGTGFDAYAYPCNMKHVISLVFDGTRYAINPLDLNLGVVATQNGVKYCLAGIVGADLSTREPLAVVGDTFLKNWYSIYNYKKGGSVSFAKSKAGK